MVFAESSFWYENARIAHPRDGLYDRSIESKLCAKIDPYVSIL